NASGTLSISETITFTLSEASTTFAPSDIDVAGGSLSNFTAVPTSGTAGTGYTQYTATFTPNASSSGTATIGVASDKFNDNAGNNNKDTYVSGVTGTTVEGNNQVSIAYNTSGSPAPADTTAPTVIVARAGAGQLATGNTDTISFTLSEASKDFTEADIDVVGGSLSNFTPVATSGSVASGYTQYTATFTPNISSSGTATIGVANGKFADAATNLNKDTYLAGVSAAVQEANNQVSIAFNTTLPDTTAPTIAVTRSGTGTVVSSETIYFTLSEASTDFALSDIDVVGGTLSNFAPVASTGTSASGFTQYTATFTPTGNSTGSALIGVASGKFADAAANLNKDSYTAGVTGTTIEANNQVILNFDTSGTRDAVAPTIAVTADKASLVTGQSATITFTLSEASTTFDATDVSATGGTLSNFTGSGKVYTATFTPNLNSTANSVISVASAKFADAAGNQNADGAEVNNTVTLSTNTIDTTPPTIAITSDKTALVSGDTATITFTLSEPVADLPQSNITVSGGTLSAITPVAGTASATGGYTQYTAVFTPTPNSVEDSVVYVASNVFSDMVGNKNQDGSDANNTLLMSTNTVDEVPPTIAITGDKTILMAGQTATITFTLSENVSDFTSSDITVNGGTLSGFTRNSTDPKVYTAIFTPTAGAIGNSLIKVASAKFSDAAGNFNADGAEANNLLTIPTNTLPADTTPPTIAVARSGTGTLTSPETITFTLSEASTSFAGNDITVTGGTLTNFTPVPTSGTAGTGYTQYSATFTPTAGTSGNATIGVASGKFADAAGNLNQDTFLSGVTGTVQEANNQVTIAFDTTLADTSAPTIAVARAGTANLAAGNTDTITFTLSEPSVDFALTDITVTGGTLSNFAPLGTSGNATSGYTQYTATFTPNTSASGTAVIGVASGKFGDATGNLNKDTYLSGVTGTTQEVNNQVSIVFDTTKVDAVAPTIVVSRASSGTLTSPETLYFTLSEASKDFTMADIDVTGGTLSNFAPVASTGTSTSGFTQYTATFIPTAGTTGSAIVGVTSGKFGDVTGNLNKDTYLGGVSGTTQEVNNQVTLSFDTTKPDSVAPTIAVTSDKKSLGQGETATITFTLSADSADFTAADVAVTGGTLSNFTGSGSVYTATFTPNADSLTNSVISVGSVKFRDAAGNFNTDGAEANNSVTLKTDTRDLVPPTIAITSDKASLVVGDTANVTFTLSEESVDFTAADIAVTGGTLSAFVQSSADPKVYTATFTPTPGVMGNSVISVASSQFSDAAGNYNADGADANNTLSLPTNTIPGDTTAPTIAIARNGSGILTSSETITFTLSEASADFALSDIDVTGGSLSNFSPVPTTGTAGTGYSQYTATFTPTKGISGNATIGVASGKFNDASANVNKDTYASNVAGTVQEANNQVSIAFDTTQADTTPPTIVVSRAGSGTLTSSETLYFTLSEASKDFDLSDIDVTGGTLTNFAPVASTG
ncbi:MAG: hypothetical protein CFE45_06590, partial [Burkholderiales bacterium PBB5]